MAVRSTVSVAASSLINGNEVEEPPHTVASTDFA